LVREVRVQSISKKDARIILHSKKLRLRYRRNHTEKGIDSEAFLNEGDAQAIVDPG